MNRILFLIFTLIPVQALAYVIQVDKAGNRVAPNNLVVQEPAMAKNIPINIDGGSDYLIWALSIFAILIIAFVVVLKFRKK